MGCILKVYLTHELNLASTITWFIRVWKTAATSLFISLAVKQ